MPLPQGLNIPGLSEQNINTLGSYSGEAPSDAKDLFGYKSDHMRQVGGVTVNDLFFNWMNLESGDAWKIYPYQFEIHNGVSRLHTLTMPLAPESISINVPTAVTTTVTMKGITEEHNAAPLRTISITGTTGIMPAPPAGTQSPGTSNLLDYMFKNTINAAQDTVSRLERLNSAVQGKNIIKTPVFNGDSLETASSGYQAVHNIDRFFSMYLGAKKQGAKEMYLSFYMHKDKMYYDCTLNGYSIRKIAGSLEYRYTINLTAWRRRAQPVYKRPGANFTVSGDLDANVLQRINDSLTLSTQALNSASQILRGVTRDYDNVVLGPIKRVALLGKAALGLGYSIGDFPNSLIRAHKNSIRSAFKNILSNDNNSPLAEALNKIADDNNLYSAQSEDPGRPAAKYDSNIIVNSVKGTENSTSAEDSPAAEQETSDPFEELFKDPQTYSKIFAQIDLNSLTVNNERLNALIAAEIEAALALTSDDIRLIKDNYESFLADYSETLGGGDDTFNRVNDRGDVRSSSKELTTEDIVLVSQLEEANLAMDSLIRLLDDQKSAETEDTDYATFWASAARTYGIDFAENSSKFYVPFEFGASLERMAVKYLGNADRWVEIAAINGLKAPYVDEEGEYRDLSSSGSGNSFSLPTAEGLYIGQIIEISSDNYRPEPREVAAIDVVSSVESIIEVKGASDLSKFVIADNPRIHFYKAGTVNSNNLIAIPSANPVNIPGNLRINPGEDDLTTLMLTAKADFMLNYDKRNFADLALTSADIKIARGMTNLTQAANIKLLTQEGELLHDPAFGNPIRVGDSTAERDPREDLASIANAFTADPRFTTVIAGRIRMNGPAVAIDVLLGVQNSQAYLPFTTEVPRGA